MRCRLYQPGDFAALYAVEQLCFAPPFRFSRAHMRRIVENPAAAAWIAEEHSALMGFSIVEWGTGPGESTAYIQTIEVHPAHRGVGVGAELLRRVECSARAAGAKSIGLHVDVENAAAMHLYESSGYLCRGREDRYYARQRAALVYVKML